MKIRNLYWPGNSIFAHIFIFLALSSRGYHHAHLGAPHWSKRKILLSLKHLCSSFFGFMKTGLTAMITDLFDTIVVSLCNPAYAVVPPCRSCG